MTSEITMLQSAAAVRPGDPDQRQRKQEQPRRPRTAQPLSPSLESDNLSFDEHDPADRPRIGLLINVRV
jgi:hypothetical protein